MRDQVVSTGGSAYLLLVARFGSTWTLTLTFSACSLVTLLVYLETYHSLIAGSPISLKPPFPLRSHCLSNLNCVVIFPVGQLSTRNPDFWGSALSIQMGGDTLHHHFAFVFDSTYNLISVRSTIHEIVDDEMYY
jgi:hypothetical protein